MWKNEPACLAGDVRLGLLPVYSLGGELQSARAGESNWLGELQSPREKFECK